MDKWKALTDYLGHNPRIKYFKWRVCKEIKCAIKAWKNDKFAPDTSVLDGLSDDEFITAYEDQFHKSVQHELSEAIEHIDIFAQKHGCDIFMYYKCLARYRELTGKVPSTNQTIIIKRYSK